MNKVKIRDFSVGEKEPLTIICGPCVIESEEHAFRAAEELKKIILPFGFNFIYKSSYDKANRSSINSFRGPGLENGLKILGRIQKELDVAVLSDVHSPQEAKEAGKILDVLQIPAFLCRQTDLLIAAAETKAAIMVKKGQFLSPQEMGNVVDKIVSANNRRIILADRGTCFGYNTLINDMRAIPIMKRFGFPVCFDATHSVQQPGSLGQTTGGQREFIPTLTKAAVAAGCNLLFFEAHPHPQEAKSDSSSVLDFETLKILLKDVQKLYNTVKELVC